MNAPRRKRFTLMPAVALAALSALVAIPALSQSRLYAASAEHFAGVTVQPGDNLWRIAARYTRPSGSVQDTVDAILSANHLESATISVGQRIEIPR